MLLAAGAIAWPQAASAGLYKCARADGSVIYQEDSCGPGRELRDFERDPATLSVVPFERPPSAATTASGSTGRKREPNAGTPRPASGRASGGSPRISRKAADRTGNPAERKFLAPGLGEGEVLARVGRPDLSTAAGRKTVHWTYLPAPEDPQTITTLTFELGRLLHVERKVVPAR